MSSSSNIFPLIIPIVLFFFFLLPTLEEDEEMEVHTTMSQLSTDLGILQVQDPSVRSNEGFVMALNDISNNLKSAATLWYSVLSNNDNNDYDKDNHSNSSSSRSSGGGVDDSDKAKHSSNNTQNLTWQNSQKIIKHISDAAESVASILKSNSHEGSSDDTIIRKSVRFIIRFLAVIQLMKTNPEDELKTINLFHPTFQTELASITEKFLITFLTDTHTHTINLNSDDSSSDVLGDSIRNAVMKNIQFLKLFCQSLSSITSKYTASNHMKTLSMMITILQKYIVEDGNKNDCVLNLELASLIILYVTYWKGTDTDTDNEVASNNFKFDLYDENEAQRMFLTAMKHAVTAAIGIKMFMGLSLTDSGSGNDNSTLLKKERSLGITLATAPSIYQDATELIYRIQCLTSRINKLELGVEANPRSGKNSADVPDKNTSSINKPFGDPIEKSSIAPPAGDELGSTFKQYLRGFHWMPSIESFRHVHRSD